MRSKIELHRIRRDVMLWTLGGLEENHQREDPFIAAVRRCLSPNGKAPWGELVELARAFGLKPGTAGARIHRARRQDLLPMMKIDKNMPVPKRTGNGRPFKYDWAREMTRLVVGDSFFEPAATSEDAALIRSTMTTRAKKLCFKTTTRILTEKGALGVRCWRIA